MTPSELLDLFVDGELDSTHEVQLFNALAGSSDLRSEFSNLMSIRSNIHADHAAFAPSAATTKSVFTALNFTAPTSSATAVAPIVGRWARVRLSTISGIVGAAVMALLMWQFAPWYDSEAPSVAGSTVATTTAASTTVAGTTPGAVTTPGASTSNIHNTPSISKQPVAETASPALGKAPVAASNTTMRQSAPARDNRSISPPVRHRSSVSLMRTESSRSTRDLVDTRPNASGALSKSIDFVRTREVSASGTSLLAEPNAAQNPGTVPSRIDVPQSDETLSDESSGRIALQVSSISAKSFPEVSVPSANDAIPVNIAIGAYRSLTKSSSIGIEVGRESFSQRFTGTTEQTPGIGLASRTLRDELSSSNRNTYEQNPNVLWACLGVRQEFVKVGDFSGLAHLLVGGTELGPLTKVLVGTHFSASSSLNLQFEFEASLMAYTYQNSWFTSSKLGIRYGMSLSF